MRTLCVKVLDAGSVSVVDRIATVKIAGRVRYNLSFASKYCSWHQQGSYPIYDANAEWCLWAYRQQFGLSFHRKDLWSYPSFVAAIKEFQDHFELQELTFKQIDKFLYLKGADLIEAEEKTGAAATNSTAHRETVLEIGAEGGSISLLRERTAGEDWQFKVERNESTLYDLLSEEDRSEIGELFAETGYVRSFQEGLVLLDRYPWFHLSPLKVLPEFRDSVLLEVRKRVAQRKRRAGAKY